MRFAVAIGLVALALLGTTGAAAAQDAAPLPVEVEAGRLGRPRAVYSLEAMTGYEVTAGRDLRSKLQDGFINRLVIISEIKSPLKRKQPIAPVTNLSIRYRLDLDQYEVEVVDDRGLRRRRVPTFQQVVQEALRISVPLYELEDSERMGQLRINVVVELNPLTEEMRTRIRDRVVDPRRSDSGLRDFFGGMVSFFLDLGRAEDYEARWKLKTQSFVADPPAAPAPPPTEGAP